MNINELSTAIYAQNKAVGWWDDPNRCTCQTLQLVSTEIAEATEGERKDLMDDHLPARKMGEVELADALIRVLDFGGRYGWPVDETVEPLAECSDESLTIGGKHLYLNACLVGLLHNLPHDLEAPDKATVYHYSRLALSIIATAECQCYDIEGATAEKLAYNKQRADHKRDNRAKAGGKKF